MQITVPMAPEGVHPAAARRLALAGIDPDQRGGFATLGHRLHPGDTVDLTAGTLVLSVDKTTIGYETHHYTGKEYRVEDATVTVYLVQEDGTLIEMWSRHFKSAKSAYGPAVLKKLSALLAKYPAPTETAPTLLKEVRRPNSQDAICRWCDRPVRLRTGHVVSKGVVEHWEECPTDLAPGGPCVNCGERVRPGTGKTHVIREDDGWWENRHHECDPVAGLPVLRVPTHPRRSDATDRRATNGRAAECHWCAEQIAPHQGWLVGWHETARYEHDRCPELKVTGTPECALCGVDICLGEGVMVPHHQDGKGGRRPEHRADIMCALSPARSASAVKAQQEADRAEAQARYEAARAKAAAEEKRKKDRREAARRRKEEKAAAARAEDRRLCEGATEVSRESERLQAKKLGQERRAELWEHTLTLDNGHTTKRWNVEIVGTSAGWNGEDYDPDEGESLPETDVKADAQDQYRQWSPVRHRDRSGNWQSREPLGARPCPQGRHCDHCAAPVAEGEGMSASRGLACDQGCYDAMSDDRGAHARRYH